MRILIYSGFFELGISLDVEMLDLDLQDKEEIISALQKVKPDEIYNLGDQSSVQASFYSPADTARYSGFNALLLLEAVKEIFMVMINYQADYL